MFNQRGTSRESKSVFHSNNRPTYNLILGSQARRSTILVEQRAILSASH
jgi:hypothetical protein